MKNMQKILQEKNKLIEQLRAKLDSKWLYRLRLGRRLIYLTKF